ncbi:hypothetical protein C6P42_002616 [Pichia californica]|nr:hypothetical protein C6P42_002616 [[Candida] californica]
MTNVGSYSNSSEEIDDFADFTINSINYNNNNNIPNDETITNSNNNNNIPFASVKRSKSISSFIIHPHRKSSMIIAATGEKIQRSYSTWKQLSLIPDDLNNVTTTTTQPSIPIISSINTNDLTSHSQLYLIISSFLSYIKSLITLPIIKASIAYFLASLTVYSPIISNMLGNSDSKHMVCTVVVYFHASRSVGSMIQALMFVSFALFFGIGVSVTTLSLISLYFDNQIGNQFIFNNNTNIQSPIIIFFILLICSISLGLISFCKHRVRKQTFNTACSLAAILIISCLIKEYSKVLDLNPSNEILIPWDKIISSINCVICGCCISVIICFVIWKKWAETSLINSISSVKLSIGITLSLLCDIFTNDNYKFDNIINDREKISKSFKDLKGKLNSLNSNLEETKFECLIFGKESKFTNYKDLVNSEKRLIAYLGGLRTAVEFKWEMIEFYESLRKKSSNIINNSDSDQFYDNNSNNLENVIDGLNQRKEDLQGNEDEDDEENQSIPHEMPHNIVENPEELIQLFLFHLAPSTKSFAYTMDQILTGNLYNKNNKVENVTRQYYKSLSLARDLFETHQKNAIDNLYKQEIFSKNDCINEKINQEEVAATCANFSFLLTQFSTELESFLTIMIFSLDEFELGSKKTFNFLKFWKKDKNTLDDIERNQLVNFEQLENESFGYKLWKITKFTRGVDFQFGFRVGLGALILGSFAFLDSTRHLFKEWRGEWILVTYCIIMNKSLGGTSMTLKWRFLGTFIGAFTAFSVWTLFYPNVIIMAIIGFFVSIPCFNIILNWKSNNAFGRFILLTYNLTVLYSYTMSLNDISDGDDWEGGGNPIIWEIAFHRYIGVSLGVVWAILITLTLFPVTARSRIKRGLSVLWLRMGIIWKRGALYTRRDEYEQDRLDGLRGLKDCHSIMDELRILLKQAPMEIRLKGPFPTEIYTKLMDGTEGILDAYENMNSIVIIDPILSPVESIVLENLADEMNELQNRVFLVFYMLTSALRLGIPLASDPASTENAMNKLLSKLGDIRRTVEARKEIGKFTGLKNTDFVLLYTYCLATNSIVNELTKLMEEVVSLYGRLDEEVLELS